MTVQRREWHRPRALARGFALHELAHGWMQRQAGEIDGFLTAHRAEIRPFSAARGAQERNKACAGVRRWRGFTSHGLRQVANKRSAARRTRRATASAPSAAV